MAATKRKLSVSRPLGIVANPASGKDVRRLVARASVFDNQEKRAIVVRALTGAVAAGVRQVRYFNDKHGIAATALSDLAETNSPKIRSKAVDVQPTGVALDTTAAARALKEAGCGAVIVLGGDGTSRAFTQGWRNAVLMPLSTGTNNVFPELLEATVAGTAAGLIATGALGRRAQPEVAKVIDIKIDGERDDLALIDAAFTTDRFVGTRALLAPERLRELLLTRADPAAVGMTSIGGLIKPLTTEDDYGLSVRLAGSAKRGSTALRAPIAPGYFQKVYVSHAKTVKLEQRIEWNGPGVIALDGERERYIGEGQKAHLTLRRNGPRVIDAQRVMAAAAKLAVFTSGAKKLNRVSTSNKKATKS